MLSPRCKKASKRHPLLSPRRAVASGQIDDTYSPINKKRLRNQEDRRDAEVRAVRALSEKFKDFDVESWKGKRSPSGVNPIQHVMQEQSKRMGQQAEDRH